MIAFLFGAVEAVWLNTTGLVVLHGAGLLFIVGAIYELVSLHPSAAYLELTREGFTVCHNFRRKTTPWHLSVDFRMPAFASSRRVYWTTVRVDTSGQKMGKPIQLVKESDTHFPEWFGVRPKKLAALLNALQRDYTQATLKQELALSKGVNPTTRAG